MQKAEANEKLLTQRLEMVAQVLEGVYALREGLGDPTIGDIAGVIAGVLPGGNSDQTMIVVGGGDDHVSALTDPCSDGPEVQARLAEIPAEVQARLAEVAEREAAREAGIQAERGREKDINTATAAELKDCVSLKQAGIIAEASHVSAIEDLQLLKGIHRGIITKLVDAGYVVLPGERKKHKADQV